MDRIELLHAFGEIPTGNAADALTQLGLPVGVPDADLHPVGTPQKRAAGFAVTVKQMTCSGNAEGVSLTKHAQVIDGLNEGEMLVIDAGGRTDVCTGGALLALCAKLRGASGWVVNGALRDVDEIRKLDFPVHLKGGCPVKSAPLLQTVGVNVPVEIGGVQICPGDLILTDETGIVAIPPAHAEEVLEKAREIGRREAETERLLLAGKSFAEAKKTAGI